MKIGDRVKITHKPEHDNVGAGRIASWRAAANGKAGQVHTTYADGDALVTVDGCGAMWFRPDELTPLDTQATTDEARALAALNVSREAIGHRPVADWGPNDLDRAAWFAVVRTVDASNPAVQELRDELAAVRQNNDDLSAMVREAGEELASVKAAHAEAERLLGEARQSREQARVMFHAERDARIEAERRENETRAAHEVTSRVLLETTATLRQAQSDAQHTRDRLSAVKAAVDAVRETTLARALDAADRGEMLHVFAAVDRALAGVPATGEGSMPANALAPILAAQSTSWPIYSVLVKLADAADHLLRGHGCDRHGYEEVEAARDAAREMIAGTGVEPDRFTSRFAVGDACHPRPTLTEEQARVVFCDEFPGTWFIQSEGFMAQIGRLLARVSRGEHAPEKPAPADPDANPSRLEVLKRRVDRCDADVRDVMRRLAALERVEVEKSHETSRANEQRARPHDGDPGAWHRLTPRELAEQEAQRGGLHEPSGMTDAEKGRAR